MALSSELGERGFGVSLAANGPDVRLELLRGHPSEMFRPRPVQPPEQVADR
jgi:hypothetical protein